MRTPRQMLTPVNRGAALVLIILIPGFAGLLSAETPTKNPLSLVVEITGLDPRTGEVRCALFDSREDYLKSATRSVVLTVDVEKDRLLWRVEGLNPGLYALAIHHDVNGNGKNDRNLFGIPSEPYAFSRGARARFGPPSWRRASFSADEPETRVELEVR